MWIVLQITFGVLFVLWMMAGFFIFIEIDSEIQIYKDKKLTDLPKYKLVLLVLLCGPCVWLTTIVVGLGKLFAPWAKVIKKKMDLIISFVVESVK